MLCNRVIGIYFPIRIRIGIGKEFFKCSSSWFHVAHPVGSYTADVLEETGRRKRTLSQGYRSSSSAMSWTSSSSSYSHSSDSSGVHLALMETAKKNFNSSYKKGKPIQQNVRTLQHLIQVLTYILKKTFIYIRLNVDVCKFANMLSVSLSLSHPHRLRCTHAHTHKHTFSLTLNSSF